MKCNTESCVCSIKIICGVRHKLNIYNNINLETLARIHNHTHIYPISMHIISRKIPKPGWRSSSAQTVEEKQFSVEHIYRCDMRGAQHKIYVYICMVYWYIQ